MYIRFKFEIFFLLLLLINTATPTDNKKQDELLNIEVEWILQTRTFTFTGFMVEILGLMDGFMALLPQFRLLPSFYTNFDDIPYDERLLKGMFPKESNGFLQLQSKVQPAKHSAYNIPSSHIFGIENLDVSQLCYNGREREDKGSPADGIREGVAMIGGDLNRNVYELAQTAEDCCRACLAQPLCVGWSFEHACNFKRATKGATSFTKHASSFHLSCVRHLLGLGVIDVVSPNASSGSFQRSTLRPQGRRTIPRCGSQESSSCYRPLARFLTAPRAECESSMVPRASTIMSP